MEDVLGPLEKLIPYLLQKLDDELYLSSDAKKELEDLEDLMGAVRRFLNKANSSEFIDEELKVSMKKMRKILFDSQGAIDDLMQRESNWECASPATCLCRHYNRRTFALEAKDIKTMLPRYKTTLETVNAFETRHQLTGDLAQSSSAWNSSLSIFLEENGNELVGIDEARKQLVRWLTQDNSMSKVIFVHGAPGVGKTSLVSAVLHHQSLRRYFKYYVWMVEGKASVLMKADAKRWHNPGEQVEHEEAFRRMKEDKYLRKNKYRWLLVLDEISSENVLESLKKHLHQTRPSVLVTARDSSLASKIRAFLDSLGAQCGGAPPEPPKGLLGAPNFKDPLNFLGRGQEPSTRLYGFHNFKHDFLSPDDSFTLFSRNCPEDCRPIDFKEASDCILKKCEGLPLAVLATTKLLIATKDDVNGTSPSAAWQTLSCRLGQELISKGGTNDLIRRMVTLRMDRNVHDCLLYLSVFPLDYPIRCSTLIRLWMAERLIEQEGLVQTIAGQTLKKLLDQNLIQEVEKTSYGKVRTCRVHNVLHQIIICKSKDDELAMIVTDREEEWPQSIYRLSFHSDMDRTKVGTWAERLCSLLVFITVYPKSMKELLKQVKRLKVLDLQRRLTKEEEDLYQASLNLFPKEIYRLKYLRYLSLRDTNVSTLPDGIGCLAHLETLDLKGTLVHTLPDDILKLEKLRHLLVYRSDKSSAAGGPKLGVKAPSALGDLTSLQKLCMIELNPVKRSILWVNRWKREQLLEELKKLASLRRLGISMLRSEDVKLLCSSIEELTKLEALHLIAAPRERIDLSMEDRRKAPECLQRVHLTGCFGSMPNWLLSPKSLVKLVLKRSQLNGDPLQQLGELQALKHLELQQAFNVCVMTFKARWFRQLRFLCVDSIDSLESIRVEKEALPTLEILSLARCQSLKTVPQGITLPGELKRLELYGMPEEFNTAVKRNEEIRKHINVNFKDWKDGALEVVITLPAQPAGSPSAPPPCMK